MYLLSSCFTCFTPSASTPDPIPTALPFSTLSQVKNTFVQPAHLSEELKNLGSHSSWIKSPCLRSGFKMNLSRSELNKTFRPEKLMELNHAQQLRFIQRAHQTIKTCDSVTKPIYLYALLLKFQEALLALNNLDLDSYKPSPRVIDKLNDLLALPLSLQKTGSAHSSPDKRLLNIQAGIATNPAPTLQDSNAGGLTSRADLQNILLSIKNNLKQKLEEISCRQDKIFELADEAFKLSFRIDNRTPESEQKKLTIELSVKLKKIISLQEELMPELNEFIVRNKNVPYLHRRIKTYSPENAYELEKQFDLDIENKVTSLIRIKSKLVESLKDVTSKQEKIFRIFGIILLEINQPDLQNRTIDRLQQSTQEELQKLKVIHQQLLNRMLEISNHVTNIMRFYGPTN